MALLSYTARPKRCKLLHVSQIVKTWDESRHPESYMGRSTCKVCYARSEVTGSMAAGGLAGRRMPDGAPVPRVYRACSGCKVNLCPGCFDSWDHVHNRPKGRGVVILCSTVMDETS